MHGSLHSMVGDALSGSADLGWENGWSTGVDGRTQPTWIDGPYSLAAYADGDPAGPHTGIAVLPATTSVGAITLGRVEMWIRGDTIHTSVTDEAVYVQMDDAVTALLRLIAGIYNDRRVTLRIANSGGDVIQIFGPTVPDDGAWHFVGVTWDLISGTKVVKLRCDTTTTTSNPVFTSALLVEQPAHTVSSTLPIAEVHISTAQSTEPWLNEAAFTPEAVLDRSLLDLAAAAYGQPIEVWQLLADLAGAENAVSAWDEDGVYRYRTRRRLVDTAGQTVQVTLADDTHITDLALDTSVARVRNVVQVPWTTPEAKFELSYIWQSSSPVKLPRPVGDGFILVSQAVEVPIGWSSVPLAVDTSPVIQTATPPATTDSYFIVNTRADGLGTNLTANLSATITNWTSVGASIVFDNLNGFDAYVIEAGIVGYAFGGLPEATSTAEDADSIRRYRRQPLQVSQSPWMQTADVATRLGQLILADTREPAAVITNLRIVGDPRLQLGDRVRIVDRYGAHLDGEYWLTSIDESWGGGKYVMTVSARQASTVAVWDETRWDQSVWGP